MAYGLPYCGSKNSIARKIINCLPEADTFVDLFCGGCAMTHAAIMSRKYKHFIINDINPLIVQFFMDALAGKFHDEKRWISKEEYNNLYGIDPIATYCFTFGNGTHKTYMYGEKTALFKKALHYSRILDDDTLIDDLGIKLENLTKEQLKLQSADAVHRVQALEMLSPWLPYIKPSSMDYRQLEIPKNSVVYCDIPYKGTDFGYVGSKRGKFDWDSFYDWAREHKCYISEYNMPKDFQSIEEFERFERLSSYKDKTRTVTEKLYLSPADEI